jgi:tripartite-type tricarboxylate transporter receptor subunit TctC
MSFYKILVLSVLFFISTSVKSQIVVPIIWPFAVGSNQVIFTRLIAQEANAQQSKYKFIVDFKAGAGGYIAARTVQEYKGLAILHTSSSFYSRPVFYPNESHRVEDFKPVYIECIGQPYLILSAKFKTLDELKKQSRITIGANLGSITEAMVRELKLTLPNVEVDIIPFTSGTLGSTQELLAGRLDLNVDLPGESMQYIETEKLNVVGSSGTIDHTYLKTFNSQGFKGFSDLVSSYAMYVKNNTDSDQTKELHDIFSKAAIAAGSKLQEAYARDYCPGVNFTLKESTDIFNKWVKYWPEKLSNLK